MRVMNSITDKPEWDRKVFDLNITSKWRDEITESGEDITPRMIDWVIKELQWKAGIFDETGYVQVFDTGVVKSDAVISQELRQALKDASVPLSNIPEDEKDYHPGSDNKVVDLVHPSLFPVIYGRTRVLPDRTIGLNDSIEAMGYGSIVPQPTDEQILQFTPHLPRGLPVFSKSFQWLPCDVEFTEEGCKIVSYINNLHPEKHRDLYGVIEKIISKTIPLWNKSLEQQLHKGRIDYKEVEYGEHSEPEPQYPGEHWDEEAPEWDTFDEEAWGEIWEGWAANRPILLPEPGEFKPRKSSQWERVDLRTNFPGQRLQVIVKMANIELTPDNPEYEGGSWHIEGQLFLPVIHIWEDKDHRPDKTNTSQNERIAASAIYYYDNENITPSNLSFRQRASCDFEEPSYEQDRHEFIQAVYGFDEANSRGETNITQELGGIKCDEGRLITFPNTLQHRVSPFQLADKSKSGHRKILALFLVDPHRRVISSANVPPQREDWFPSERKERGRDDGEQVVLDSDAPPCPGPGRGELMSVDEAREHRLELMAERSLRSAERNQNFEIGEFNLCEH
ncbi:hypothetical protein N7481_003589 [Penicillium waksmanii]|uniref:uncharacterized protein n=1 Tax=Penicillium waksmanii TaxID=69791 RepID=UPI00254714FA|nr:uncharacterized protein N7481_003589 [Penicillium waksmanii]KAJ5988379.1 hypothetical protein N7481_003589 [Penicillium waksmanii]